jgi:hypothetical protein
MVLGLVVAVVLLGAIAFVPIVALLVWLVIASITLCGGARRRTEISPRGAFVRGRRGSARREELRRCGGTC